MAGACSRRNTFLPISARSSADCIPEIPAPITNAELLSPLTLISFISAPSFDIASFLIKTDEIPIT
jgi:hypothetical protein